MSKAYYNEIDPKAAAWLRELIVQGLIAQGEVDERDIRDIKPSELMGYTQCHFFAGIGGWSRALRLAGWPDDRPVWTGSCPCQPFSAAGARRGTTDERHLWPHWFHLIRVCRSGAIFGEQVASKDGITWLDLVSSDLEGEGYTCGPVVFPACGIGSPNKRDRLWFVADSDGWDSSAERLQRGREQRQLAQDGLVSNLANPMPTRRTERRTEPRQGQITGGGGASAKLATAERAGGAVCGFWADAEWIYCRDEKYRAVEPGTFPLAHGLPERMGRLRGYGNAINPEVAKEFIGAYLDIAAQQAHEKGER